MAAGAPLAHAADISAAFGAETLPGILTRLGDAAAAGQPWAVAAQKLVGLDEGLL